MNSVIKVYDQITSTFDGVSANHLHYYLISAGAAFNNKVIYAQLMVKHFIQHYFLAVATEVTTFFLSLPAEIQVQMRRLQHTSILR